MNIATYKRLCNSMFRFVGCSLLLMLMIGCSSAPINSPTSAAPAVAITEVANTHSVIPSATQPQERATQPSVVLSAEGSPSTPISVRLDLAGVPSINTEITLTLTIHSIKSAPATTATIIVPEGIELLNGTLTWHGDLNPQQPRILTAVLRFTTFGDFELVGRALSTLDTGDIWGDQATLFLTVRDPQQSTSSTPTPPPAIRQP